MIVGNDVVDLEDPEAVGAARRERFVRRILRPAELRVLERAREPDAALWSFFAAKEAAYKAIVRLRGGAPSAPSAYDVSCDLASVRLSELRLRLHVHEADGCGFIHAVAWIGARPEFGVGVSRGDPGAEARTLAIRCVALTSGWPSSILRIVRDPQAGAWDGLGPPWLERDGVRLDACVSLSHHGRFVAYAHGH